MPATLSLEAPRRRISVEAPRPAQRGSSAGTEHGRPGVPCSEDEASGGGRLGSRPEGGSGWTEPGEPAQLRRGWGAVEGGGSRARLGSPGAGSRRGRPEPQAWDRREGRHRPRGTSHLPSCPRSRPLGSARPHLSGTSNAPRHPAPDFSSPRTGGGIVCGDFTEMLIRRSQSQWPREAGRGHRGVRRCASLGWEPPDGHPSRNAGVSRCPPPVLSPPSRLVLAAADTQ